MAVDIRSIEIALVKTVRAYIGDKLATIGNSQILWQTTGTGLVSNPSHIFSGVTVQAAEVVRNSYFSSNPSELIEDVQCTLLVNSDQILQQYKNTIKAAVIRSRLYSTGTNETTPTLPDYPYASVDYTRLTDEGYELTSRHLDEDENYVYTTHKLASYSIKFFGTSQDDVMRLANEMHMLFEVDQVRSMVTNLSATEARVRSKSDIVFVASNMEDKYREVASFDVVLAVIDQVVVPADPLNPPTDKYNAIVNDSAAEYIENIDMDTQIPVDGVQGGLYIEGDEDPVLHVDVNTNLNP